MSEGKEKPDQFSAEEMRALRALIRTVKQNPEPNNHGPCGGGLGHEPHYFHPFSRNPLHFGDPNAPFQMERMGPAASYSGVFGAAPMHYPSMPPYSRQFFGPVGNMTPRFATSLFSPASLLISKISQMQDAAAIPLNSELFDPEEPPENIEYRKLKTVDLIGLLGDRLIQYLRDIASDQAQSDDRKLPHESWAERQVFRSELERVARTLFALEPHFDRLTQNGAPT